MSKEARHPRRLRFAKSGVYLLGALILFLAGLGVFMVAYPKRIAAGAKVGPVEVGLLSEEDARARLLSWWEERSASPIEFKGLTESSPSTSMTPVDLGLSLDIEGTLAQLPKDTFAAWFDRSTGRSLTTVSQFDAVLDTSSLDERRLEQIVVGTAPPLAPAKVALDEEGRIVRTPEVSTMGLVRADTEVALRRTVSRGGACKVVAEYKEKAVQDRELEKITEVVSTFSTKFSAGDRSRSSNLKTAAAKLDGTVVLPGERFSFNEHVGERTQENGFSLAGVYRHGKHEIDWGGGVCQVSTTLFNAVVLANMKVEVRNNHTFLVPYVPIGRDAAVAYGAYDFVFVNTLGTPIAIDSKYETGKLTFTILGVKDAGLEVKLEPVVTSSWSHEPVYVEDPALKPGEQKVIEKGGKGYRAVTTKVVLRDGKEVSREVLCRSHYKGGPKIIARGPVVPAVVQPDGFPDKVPPITDGGRERERADLPGRPLHRGY